MVAVKSGEIDSFLKRVTARNNPVTPAVYLIFGPNTGLVHERSETLAASFVDDIQDPFQLIHIDGDSLTSDSSRLIDEANTISLFGGKRCVWVRSGSKTFSAALEPVLKSETLLSPIIIEAGDIKNTNPLRTACEKSKIAYCIPCYTDTERDIAALVDQTIRNEGLTLSKEARLAVLENLSGDRLATQSELSKLILYAQSGLKEGRNEISVEDVEAILANVSNLITDAVIDAAFSGNAQRLEKDAQRLIAEGIHGSVVLNAALRHAFQLLSMKLDIDQGTPISKSVEQWRGLHFKRKATIAQQVGRLSSSSLNMIIQNVSHALLETRQQPVLANTITLRTLLQISVIRK